MHTSIDMHLTLNMLTHPTPHAFNSTRRQHRPLSVNVQRSLCRGPMQPALEYLTRRTVSTQQARYIRKNLYMHGLQDRHSPHLALHDSGAQALWEERDRLQRELAGCEEGISDTDHRIQSVRQRWLEFSNCFTG